MSFIQANYQKYIETYCTYKQKSIQLLGIFRTQRILLTEVLLKESIKVTLQGHNSVMYSINPCCNRRACQMPCFQHLIFFFKGGYSGTQSQDGGGVTD